MVLYIRARKVLLGEDTWRGKIDTFLVDGPPIVNLGVFLSGAWILSRVLLEKALGEGVGDCRDVDVTRKGVLPGPLGGNLRGEKLCSFLEENGFLVLSASEYTSDRWGAHPGHHDVLLCRYPGQIHCVCECLCGQDFVFLLGVGGLDVVRW